MIAVKAINITKSYYANSVLFCIVSMDYICGLKLCAINKFLVLINRLLLYDISEYAFQLVYIKVANFFFVSKKCQLIHDSRKARFLRCLIPWNNLVETNEMESFKPIPTNSEVF